MKKRSARPTAPSDDTLDATLASAIADELAPRARVPAETRARLFDRVLSQIDGAQHRYHPAQDGDWRVLGERVYLKVIERDEATGHATYLVRYSPGTSFPRHPQRTVEECLLVAGDLRIGEVDMRPGDLQVAVPGLEHGPLVSEHGALVFVRGVLTRVPEERAPPFEAVPR